MAKSVLDQIVEISPKNFFQMLLLKHAHHTQEQLRDVSLAPQSHAHLPKNFWKMVNANHVVTT